MFHLNGYCLTTKKEKCISYFVQIFSKCIQVKLHLAVQNWKQTNVKINLILCKYLTGTFNTGLLEDNALKY